MLFFVLAQMLTASTLDSRFTIDETSSGSAAEMWTYPTE